MSLYSLRRSVHDNVILKRILIVIVAILGLGVAFAGLGNNLGGRNAAASYNPADQTTVAVVNGASITRTEFDSRMRDLQNSGQSMGTQQTAYMKSQVLDQLITAELLLQQAQKLGIKVSDSEIEQARNKWATQQGIREKLGLKADASMADVDSALARNGAPSVELMQPDDQITQALTLNKLQSYLAGKVMVSEQDARDYYQQWHTRHILIKNTGRSDVQAQSLAEQVLAKAKAPGADFAALAKQYSEDPGTKSKGGDDGWIDQNTDYVPEFKKAAFTLKAGEITPALVKSPQYGYFIIKCDALRSKLPKDFDKNKAKYIDQVKQQKVAESDQEFMQSAKDNPANKIVVQDPILRADRALNESQTAADPTQREAKLQAALADFQKALAQPNLTSSDKAEINAQIAGVYQGKNQIPQAIGAYEASLAAYDDPQIRLSLGNLYLQDKNQPKAIENFQAASKAAWDDQNVHMQLFMNYNQMKRKDLAAQEMAWMKQYQKAHPQQAGAGGPTFGNAPGAPAPQPVAGAAVAGGPKPAQ